MGKSVDFLAPMPKNEFIRKNNLLDEELTSSKNNVQKLDINVIKEMLEDYFDFSKNLNLYIPEILSEIVVKKINYQKNDLYLKIHLKIPINKYSSSYKNNKMNINYVIY